MALAQPISELCSLSDRCSTLRGATTLNIETNPSDHHDLHLLMSDFRSISPPNLMPKSEAPILSNSNDLYSAENSKKRPLSLREKKRNSIVMQPCISSEQRQDAAVEHNALKEPNPVTTAKRSSVSIDDVFCPLVVRKKNKNQIVKQKIRLDLNSAPPETRESIPKKALGTMSKNSPTTIHKNHQNLPKRSPSETSVCYLAHEPHASNESHPLPSKPSTFFKIQNVHETRALSADTLSSGNRVTLSDLNNKQAVPRKSNSFLPPFHSPSHRCTTRHPKSRRMQKPS